MTDRDDDLGTVVFRQWLGHSTVGGGYNVQIGAHAGELPVIMDRPRCRLELRTPAPVPIPHVPAAQQGPSCLLRPQRQVVPFHPRPIDQQRLLAWRDKTADPISVLWLHAPTGYGKTRIAGRLASLSYRDGWAVAQAVECAPQSTEALPAESEDLGERQSLLVIVEYADRWPTAVLADLLNCMPGDFARHRVRVLLLARSAESWRRLADEVNRDAVALPQPQQLADFARGYSERLAVFNEAGRAFADHLRVARASLGPPVELVGPAYASPLMLHMAALAAVYANRDHELVPRRQERLPGFLLEHERHYWASAALSEAALSTERMEQLVVLATLFGPMRDLSARRELLRRTGLAKTDGEADLVLAVHSRLYPPSLSRFLSQAEFELDYRGMLMPLQPDGFAEELVGQHFAHHAATIDLLHSAVGSDTGAFDSLAIRRCLIVLAATAERHPGCRTALLALLQRQPDLLALAPDLVLRLVVEHGPAELIDAALAKGGTEQLRHAVSLVKRRLEAPQTGMSLADRAHRLALMANRLAEAGRHAEALTAVRESVDAYRRLAEDDPATFTPRLAMTLQHQGGWFVEVGQHEPARIALREAVELYRDLARADPGDFEPALAAALDHMEAGLSKIGRHDEALAAARDAAEVYQRLAAAAPDRFDPDLARALEVLRARLAQSGLAEEALAATRDVAAVYRRLAAAGPYDRALAAALSVLTERETDDRLLAAADEAVEVYQRLVAASPGEFEPELAAALRRSGAALFAARRDEDALHAIRHAVAVYRRLARSDADRFQAPLAGALQELGLVLSDLGRHDQALDACREAVELYRPLAAADAAVHEPALAQALDGMAAALAALGQTEEAVGTAEAAVAIYRRWAAGIDGLEPALASALENLGVGLAELGRADEAVTALAEAVQTYRRLVGTDATTFEPALAAALDRMGALLADSGQTEHAVAALSDAVAIYGRWAEADRAGFDPVLGPALDNLAVGLAELGRPDEAVASITAAVEIYRRLADTDAGAFQAALAAALGNQGIWLHDLGRPEEGLLALEEAAKIYRSLAASDRWSEPELAAMLEASAATLSDLERDEQALAATTESVEIYRRLAAADHASFDADLGRALGTYALVRIAGQVDLDDALTAADEAVRICRRLHEQQPDAYAEHLHAAQEIRADVMDAMRAGREAEDAPDEPRIGPR